MAFSDIIGQETAVRALETALAADAVPQAYLFIGPESVGKTTAATELAQALCCQPRLEAAPSLWGDEDSASAAGPSPKFPCGACVNCRRIVAGEHPDVIRIAPDGEMTKIWQLWSRSGHPPGALESLHFAPVAAPKKIFILERAETLNDETANSLLKALEEPPAYVHFILCAPSPASVLPTILSRSQMIRFRPVSTARIAEWLIAQKQLAPSDARLLAAEAQGAPGRALRIADTPEAQEQRGALLEIAARISDSPPIAGFRLAEDLRAAASVKSKKAESETGTVRGDLTRALDVLAAWHSDLLTVALRGESAPLIHEDRRASAVRAAARYPLAQLIENVETILESRRHISRNANAQIATEVLMLRLIPKKRGA